MAFAAVYSDNLSEAGATGSSWVLGDGCYYALSHAIWSLDRRWGAYCDDPDR
jgi:hypothetical protein